MAGKFKPPIADRLPIVDCRGRTYAVLVYFRGVCIRRVERLDREEARAYALDYSQLGSGQIKIVNRKRKEVTYVA